MELETERLLLTPLTPQQLKLWLYDIQQLERVMNCTYCAEPMEGLFREIVAGQLHMALKDEDHYLWHSFWFLVRKSDRVVVGSADFKNVPDDKGEVEIGYGLGKAFEHNGYMTEAIQSMCKWALLQKVVKHVIAETEADGFASQKILKRCGFKEYLRGQTLWWKL